MDVIRIQIFSKKDFRRWLQKNHHKEKIVELLIHKKHTGKKSPSHRELMEEGICFGWIDTVIRSVDSEKYIRTFQRRSKNSKWSYNTLACAKQLIKEKKMTPYGFKFYNEGRKKLPHDYGIPKNPAVPLDLKKELEKNKKAMKNFNALAPSSRRTYLWWLFRAKLPATRKKRIIIIIKAVSKEKKNIMSWSKINQ